MLWRKKLDINTLKDLEKIKHQLKKEISNNLIFENNNDKHSLIASMVLLFISNLSNYDFEKVFPTALAIELLGYGAERHYGNGSEDNYKHSLIEGDFFYAKAFSFVAPLKDNYIIKLLADAIAEVAEAESYEFSESHSIENYYKKLAKKAALYRVAGELGAYLGKADEKLIDLAGDFGKYIGMAYLIRLEMRNFISSDSELNLLRIFSSLGETDVLKRAKEETVKMCTMAEQAISDFPLESESEYLKNMVVLTAAGISNF